MHLAPELIRAGDALAAPDMRPLMRGRLLQGQGESCVAFSVASALQMGMMARLPEAQWASVPLPSPAWLWAIGRRQEQAGSDTRPALTNRGTYPRKMVTALQNLGWVTWAMWPYIDTEASIHDAPVPCYHAGYKARDAWVAWFTPGPGLVAQIARSLSGLVPVVLCVNVDDAFMRYVGGTILALDPNATAGHAMQVVAVLDDGACVLRNWWPEGWSAPGDQTCTMARSVVEGENVKACFGLVPPAWPPIEPR